MIWIEVEEEFPPMMQTVILAFSGGVTVGWLESSADEDPSYCSWEIRSPEGVTHWMPLPHHPIKSRMRLNGDEDDIIQDDDEHSHEVL